MVHKKYRALPMSLMMYQVGSCLMNYFVACLRVKFSHMVVANWSTNWDIILVVLSQLDTFVDVQRLTKMI